MKLFITKLILKPIVILRKLYWWVIKPTTIGVRAIIVKNSQILLVKHSYSNEWHLPGGKVGKREGLINAITRELSQEIGLKKIKGITLLGTYSNFYEYKSDYISVFVISDLESKFISHFEIEKITYFDINNLPEKISPGTKRRIEEYLKNKIIDYSW